MSLPQPARPELNFRRRKILYAVITEYISTGEPVGSRRLAKRYGLNLSPATIRNVLSDLEEAGFLQQPHTSAGRVPTDAGFRVFVDALVQMRELGAEDKAAIVARMSDLDPESDDVVREAARLLSAMTGTAALSTSPRAADERLSQLRFMQLKKHQLLAVLVTRSGSVQNRVLSTERDLSPAELERVNNYLVELVQGRTVADVRALLAREMEDERGRYDELRLHAREFLEAAAAGEEPAHIVIEGQGRLFDRPEFSNVEKIRGYLRAFEDKARLVQLLDDTLAAGGVNVLIGSEANLVEVQDISVISAQFRKAGTATGTIGIIGPTRVDYAKLVPLVGFTAQCVTELLGEPPADEDG